jgi:Na+/melibiose symporter-like transporter
MNEKEIKIQEKQRKSVEFAEFFARRPFSHFVLLYCYFYTFSSAFNDLTSLFFTSWTSHSKTYNYLFALWMALWFFLFSRYKFRRLLPPKNNPNQKSA